MDDYRDAVAALNARIEELEHELDDARSAQGSGPLRCPHCRRKMLVGTLGTSNHFGHKGDVVDLSFRPNDGGDSKTIDRATAHGSDGFCEDCSTVVVKGRFAD